MSKRGAPVSLASSVQKRSQGTSSMRLPSDPPVRNCVCQKLRAAGFSIWHSRRAFSSWIRTWCIVGRACGS